jgi:hypothetical protein
MGALDGAVHYYEGQRLRFNEVKNDFTFYNTINWLGSGSPDMVLGAVNPDDPYSAEHWMNSFGTATLVTGGVAGAASTGLKSGTAGSINTVNNVRVSSGVANTQRTDGPRVSKVDNVTGTSGLQIKNNKLKSAESTNTWWKDTMGYNHPPYKPGTIVNEFELARNTTFVRVYDGDVSGMYGGWVMRAEDIKGLTPAQIRDKFALPAEPRYIVDVKLSEGTRMRTGVVNEVPEWGKGGGTQFDLMGQRTGEFVNPRELD